MESSRLGGWAARVALAAAVQLCTGALALGLWRDLGAKRDGGRRIRALA